MEETVRALPDSAVQETSFEDDIPTEPTGDDDDIEAQVEASEQQHPSSSHADILSRQAEPPSTTNQPHDEHGITSQLTTASKSTARALAPDLLRGLLMVLMVLDHNSILNLWPHETALGGEYDNGVPVHKWNQLQPYVIRLLTYLWPPGLTFLLATGIVYFGRSRMALDWSSWRIARHFFTRALLLTFMPVFLGLLLSGGRLWFLNLILFSLAVDYLVTGLLWIVVTRTEEVLAFLLLRVLPDSKDDDSREPLLADRRGEQDIAPDRKIIRAADSSWHIHNGFLLALVAVTIKWNIWLSPTGGQCQDGQGPSFHLAMTTSPSLPQSNWFRIWFYPVHTDHVISIYPPLAWISFAILGILYGRILLSRTWTRTALTLGNILAGLIFLLIFVLTRVLQFGNLSEGCIQIPEHKGGGPPEGNQYLVSAQSFFYLVVYPPDIAFWAYGIGFNLLLLVIFSVLPAMITSTLLQPLLQYGTSPLFFYTAHLPLLYLSRLFWFAIYGRETERTDPITGDSRGVDKVWVFWLNWVVILVLLYPLCKGYAAFKRTKGPDSIWRFF